MRVNGKQVELKESLALDKFLESNGYALIKVAVELNRKIVPRKEYAATILEDSDVLEIVCFVGKVMDLDSGSSNIAGSDYYLRGL